MRARIVGVLVAGVCVLAPGLLLAQDESNPGRWEGTFEVGANCIHAALLPTGHVIAFSGKEAGVSDVVLWNPSTRSVVTRPPLNTDLFCAGMAMLSDGRLLAPGGDVYPGHRDAQGRALGSRAAEVFDGNTRQFTRVADMAGGERWYPTAITLPDAQVLVWNGTHAGVINNNVELYNPSANSWRIVSQRPYPATYPRMHVMLNGEVFVSAVDPALYNPATNSWRSAPSPIDRNRRQGAGTDGDFEAMVSVLLPYAAGATTQRVLIAGGGNCSSPNRSAEIFTFTQAQGPVGWQAAGSMSVGRVHPTPVLLPDGKVLVVGG
jgi:hypothetical protein